MEKTKRKDNSTRISKTRIPKPLDEKTKLDLDIAKAESDINAQQSRNRIRLILGLVMAVVITILFYFIGDTLFVSSQMKNPVFLLSIGISYGLLIIGSLYFTQQSRMSNLRADLDLLNARKRILFQFESVDKTPAETASVSYFDSLVRINVENLAAYYSLVKVHTDNSFRVSLVAGIIGFVLITMGLVIGFVNDSRAEILAYISSGSGVVMEFIAGVFFYLYNKTIIRLKEYHDSLLAVQNILLSFKIVGDIQDEKEKVKMMGQMLVFLIGKKDIGTLPTSQSDGSDPPP